MGRVLEVEKERLLAFSHHTMTVSIHFAFDGEEALELLWGQDEYL